MGLRFRKSVNFGIFRVNFSKSGIGYSYGMKGFRRTKKASGGRRTTFSLPGTGFSYVHDSQKRKKSSSTINRRAIQQNNVATTTIVENTITDAQSALAKRVQFCHSLKNVLPYCLAVPFWSFILFFIFFGKDLNKLSIFFLVLCLISLVVCIILSFLQKRVKIEYDLLARQEMSDYYKTKLVPAVTSLKKSKHFSFLIFFIGNSCLLKVLL